MPLSWWLLVWLSYRQPWYLILRLNNPCHSQATIWPISVSRNDKHYECLFIHPETRVHVVGILLKGPFWQDTLDVSCIATLSTSSFINSSVPSWCKWTSGCASQFWGWQRILTISKVGRPWYIRHYAVVFNLRVKPCIYAKCDMVWLQAGDQDYEFLIYDNHRLDQVIQIWLVSHQTTPHWKSISWAWRG